MPATSREALSLPPSRRFSGLSKNTNDWRRWWFAPNAPSAPGATLMIPQGFASAMPLIDPHTCGPTVTIETRQSGGGLTSALAESLQKFTKPSSQTVVGSCNRP
jgi:hypothetical protein